MESLGVAGRRESCRGVTGLAEHVKIQGYQGSC